MDIKEKILGIVRDEVACLLYYDRKDDEDLPLGAIEKAIEDGVITAKDIYKEFKKELKKNT